MTTQSPLHALHQAAEAYFLNYGPPGDQSEVVETFGQLDMEYAALRKSVVVFDEPHMGTLRITGTERREFLNNMLTAKVDDLGAGTSIHSFWLNRQGRIDADLRLIETPDATIVRLDRHLAHSTVETLSSFIFAEDAEITQDDSTHWLSIHGPNAFKLLDIDPIEEHTNTTATINNIEISIDRFDLSGEVGLYLAVPADQAESIYTHLLDESKEFNAKPTGWLAINTARIEAGHPMYNIDFGPDTVPAESGLMDSRVNLTKGCYLGQEVVARMHARNIRKQAVVPIRLTDQRVTVENQEILQPLTGAYIYPKDQTGQTPIGAVTSSTISPMLGAIPVAFAMIKDAHTAPGTELAVTAEGTYAPCTVADSFVFWTKPQG